MRLRTDIWVGAYIRRVSVEGGFALVRRKGALEAGAVWLVISTSRDQAMLYAPAPSSQNAQSSERVFTAVYQEPGVCAEDIDKRLMREISFDEDLWVVDVDDRQGRVFAETVRL